MNNNKKTSTDMLFEKYLKQRKLSYIFEPEPTRRNHKKPDYSFVKNVKNIVVECKEIIHLPNDEIDERVTTIDLNKILEPLKRKLYLASKQIKPYTEKYDYSLIVLGKKEGWNINLKEVYWAMFGNPIFRIPIDPEGGKRFKAIPDMQVKGQFRKNNPDTKKMEFPGKYVSGVAVIKYKNGLDHYKRKLYDKYISNANVTENLEETVLHTLSFFEKGWEGYIDEIPNIYLKDDNKAIYYVEAISNPFCEKPLPRNIFNGRLDTTIMPEVITSM